MKRLSATDAILLYQERSPSDYGHCMRVTVLDIADRVPAAAAQEVRDILASAITRFDPLCSRPISTPLGLHHPLWVKDPDFTVDNHIYRVGCPSPGTERELADFVSSIASRPLDRTRPLWEIWIVEGLASGELALVTKVHHAVADGLATAQMFDEICTTEPVPIGQLLQSRGYQASPIPSKPTLVRLAVIDVLKMLPTIPGVLRRSREVRRARRDRAPEQRPARAWDARPTALNRQLGPCRRFAFTSFDLNEIKTIKDAYGVSVNDVFLAICTTSIRRLLLDRDELPDFPLIANVPVSTRTLEQQYTYGNQVGALAVRMPTDIEDPVERLLALKADVDVAKADFRLAEGARPMDVAELFPPLVHQMVVRVVRDQAGKGRPLMGNVPLSNIPGPREEVYLGDFKITSVYGLGPLVAGMGLNMTAWSYAGRLNLSLLSCRETIPDLWALAELAQDAFDELYQRCRTAGTRGC